MKGTKKQSQTGRAIRASRLEKELVIDRYGFTQGSALLNDGKSSSCCFWSLAKPRGPQAGISNLLWNQTWLQLPQTRSLSKEHYMITTTAGRGTFTSWLSMGYFPPNSESQRGTPGSGVGHNRWKSVPQPPVFWKVRLDKGTLETAAHLQVFQ